MCVLAHAEHPGVVANPAGHWKCMQGRERQRVCLGPGNKETKEGHRHGNFTALIHKQSHVLRGGPKVTSVAVQWSTLCLAPGTVLLSHCKLPYICSVKGMTYNLVQQERRAFHLHATCLQRLTRSRVLAHLPKSCGLPKAWVSEHLKLSHSRS